MLVGIAPTDSWRDVWRTLDLWALDYPLAPRGRCHYGAFSGGQEVWAHPRLRDCEGPFRLAGHSMGGYVAEAAALVGHDNGRKVLAVETYGAPSWLKPGFRWPPEIARVRYVCGWDAVPRWLSPGYGHQVPATRLPSQWGPITGPLLDHRLSSYERATSG